MCIYVYICIHTQTRQVRTKLEAQTGNDDLGGRGDLVSGVVLARGTKWRSRDVGQDALVRRIELDQLLAATETRYGWIDSTICGVRRTWVPSIQNPEWWR